MSESRDRGFQCWGQTVATILNLVLDGQLRDLNCSQRTSDVSQNVIPDPSGRHLGPDPVLGFQVLTFSSFF